MLVSGMSLLTILTLWYRRSSSALACLQISPVLGASSAAAREDMWFKEVHNLASWKISCLLGASSAAAGRSRG